MMREKIAAIVDAQRAYFASRATLSVNSRIDALKRLRQSIKENEDIWTCQCAINLIKNLTKYLSVCF